MMDVHKVGDIAIVQLGLGLFERCGDLASGQCDGVRYQQVDCLKKFTQFAKSKSLRIARVMLKTMRREAFA